MALDNEALVRRYFAEVWSSGNLAVIDELVTLHHITHDPIAGEIRGPAPIKAQVRAYRDAFPDLSFVLDDVFVSGDRVAIRWTATGTHERAFMGIAPTGKTQSIVGLSIARVANGKLLESWTSFDTLRLAQNLGLAPRMEPRSASRIAVRSN